VEGTPKKNLREENIAKKIKGTLLQEKDREGDVIFLKLYLCGSKIITIIYLSDLPKIISSKIVIQQYPQIPTQINKSDENCHFLSMTFNNLTFLLINSKTKHKQEMEKESKTPVFINESELKTHHSYHSLTSPSQFILKILEWIEMKELRWQVLLERTSLDGK